LSWPARVEVNPVGDVSKRPCHHADVDPDRAAAARAAYEATKPLKGQPAPAIRQRLRSELAARGIDDITDPQLDYMVEAITTSANRAALRHTWKRLRLIGSSLNEFRKIPSQPKWTLAPQDITSLITFREDQHEFSTVLDATALQPARDVIARLIRDLPPLDEDDDDDEQPFDCWLSCADAEDPTAPVIAQVGKYSLAALPDDAATLARDLIRVHGGTKHAVDVMASLYGSSPDTAYVEVIMPDRA
jgi:hypothetical protein